MVQKGVTEPWPTRHCTRLSSILPPFGANSVSSSARRSTALPRFLSLQALHLIPPLPHPNSAGFNRLLSHRVPEDSLQLFRRPCSPRLHSDHLFAGRPSNLFSRIRPRALRAVSNVAFKHAVQRTLRVLQFSLVLFASNVFCRTTQCDTKIRS